MRQRSDPPGNLAPRCVIHHPKLPQSVLESDKPTLKCSYQNFLACNSLLRHGTSVNIWVFFPSVDIWYILWTEKAHIQTGKHLSAFYLYSQLCHSILSYKFCKNSKD